MGSQAAPARGRDDAAPALPVRAARALDRFQRAHPSVALPYAVLKKYGDDRGGSLAALVAYYGFFSLFPLLLVFVSVLGVVLSGDPHLRARIVGSALGRFPVLGREVGSGLHGLRGNTAAIVIGGITALWAGLGVAQAAETAMNTIWDVPRARWPGFVPSRVRALGVLALLGATVVASSFASGYGSSGARGAGLAVAGGVVAFALNLGLFAFAYRVLTAEDLSARDVLPGSLLAAGAWTVLQYAGGYYLTHEVDRAGDVYGTFALVLALLVWIGLGAQVMLVCAEVNVVLRRHLWPRALVQPPLTAGDERVYAAIVRRARVRPEVTVDVSFHDGLDRARAPADEPRS